MQAQDPNNTKPAPDNSPGFSQLLTLPWRLLKAGGIPYFLLLLLGVGSITMGVEWWFQWTVTTTKPFFIEHLKHAFSIDTVYLMVYCIMWVIAFPLIVAIALFPLRIIFIQQRFVIFDFLRDLPNIFQLSISGTWWMIRLLPYYTASLIAVIIIYPYIRPHFTDIRVYYGFCGAVLLILFLASTKIIPSLLIPIVCALGLYPPYHSDPMARQVYRRSAGRLTSICILALFGLFTIFILLSEPANHAIRLGLQVFFGTYMLIVIGTTVLYELAYMEQGAQGGR